MSVIAKINLEEVKKSLIELKEKLSGSHMNEIAVWCECSIGTVYNYFNGEVSNKFMGKAMIDYSKHLLEENESNS